MRVYGPSGTRSTPFDRNPLSLQFGASATIPQGTANTIVDYTVPVGRRAQLSHVWASLIVTTVLGAAATAFYEIQFQISGGGNQIDVHVETVLAAAVGDHRETTGGQIWGRAGDRIRIVQAVGAGGAGASLGAGAIQGIEFDA